MIRNGPAPGYRRPSLFSKQLWRSWYVFFLQIPRLPEWLIAAGDYRAIEQTFRGGTCARPERFPDEVVQVYKDAAAIEGAGAFAIVIEGTVEAVAREVTARSGVPMIGIGASPACDGQILVTQDMVGLFADFTPKFVKRYADAGKLIEDAVADYAAEVRDGRFPALEHCFGVPKTKD